MIEIDLDRETLDCLGLRLAGEEPLFPRLSLLDALGPAPKAKRRPTVKQIEKESGRTVACLTVAPDGSRTFTFGQPETAAKEATLTPLEAWKEKKRARSA
jgi:hypothetical protein